MVFEATFSSGLVLIGLRNDGVDRDGRLAGGAVTNDELTLAPANRNHSVNGSNTGLKRNRNGLTLNNPGSNLLNRIFGFRSNLSFAVDRTSKGVNNTTEK